MNLPPSSDVPASTIQASNVPALPSFLPRLPWKSIATWGFVILALYTLRHFFLIIFLTFIVSYSMRSLVVFLRSQLFPNPPRFVEGALVVLCFLSLLAALYGIGAYLIPQFVRQGEGLVKRLTTPGKSPRVRFDELLRDSVGRWMFQQKYGPRGSRLYEETFARSLTLMNGGESIRARLRSVEDEFHAQLFSSRTAEDDTLLQQRGAPLLGFRQWIELVKTPAVLAEDTPRLMQEWEAFYKQQELEVPGLAPLAPLTPEQRREALSRYMNSKLLSSTGALSENLHDEWKSAIARSYSDFIRRNQPERYHTEFKNFYEKQHAKDPFLLPVRFDEYLSLQDLLTTPDSVRANEIIARLLESPARRDALSRNFEQEERAVLVEDWKKGEFAAKIQEKIQESAVSAMSSVGRSIGEIIPAILVFPFHLGLVLLLSFFITLDVPRLSAGIKKLEHSRIGGLYEEIVPGLVNFGRLIGRAFQAQAVIAFANSLLTIIALRILGIQNDVFLCAVVFFCSFIPVLGVVFSSVPIALMALIQEDGGLLIAVWAIVAILIIHFIETSFLNPRILGNMLHLDPVLVLVILALSEHFFGVWGLLLGVPVAVYIIRVVILNEGIPGLIDAQPAPVLRKGVLS